MHLSSIGYEESIMPMDSSRLNKRLNTAVPASA